MVICKEIDYYLKYAEEHPNWINKKRKLLLKNIVKPLLKRDDVFFDEKTYRNCIKYCESNYYKLFPFQKFIYAFAFMYKNDIPVFPKFFIKEGRGNGKDGFIVPLVNFFQTPLYGVKNYHVEIVANSEDQVKDTFKVAYDMLHDNGVTVCDTQEQMEDALRRKCEEQYESGVDKPKVTIAVNMELLQNTELYADVKDLEKVSLGDTVHCNHSKLDITSDARAIELEWDAVRDKITSVTLGEFQYNFLNNVSSVMNRVEQAIREDGTLIGQQVQGIINGVKAQMKAQSTVAKKQSVRAVLFEDLDPGSATYGAMCLGTLGFEIASKRTEDGRDWDWSTFGTGRGFIADFIVAGTMLADRIKGGTLTLGGDNNTNGIAKVLDAKGNEIVRLDKDGVYAWGKYISDGKTMNKRVTLEEGTLMFSDKAVSNTINVSYANYPNGVGPMLAFRIGGTATDATNAKTILRLTKDCTYIDTPKIQFVNGTGKTGRLEFSDGTYIDVSAGGITGGHTKEGDF